VADLSMSNELLREKIHRREAGPEAAAGLRHDYGSQYNSTNQGKDRQNPRPDESGELQASGK